MLEQSTMHPVVWINQHTYISIVKNADYNLEVWGDYRRKSAASDGPDELQISP